MYQKEVWGDISFPPNLKTYLLFESSTGGLVNQDSKRFGKKNSTSLTAAASTINSLILLQMRKMEIISMIKWIRERGALKMATLMTSMQHHLTLWVLLNVLIFDKDNITKISSLITNKAWVSRLQSSQTKIRNWVERVASHNHQNMRRTKRGQEAS